MGSDNGGVPPHARRRLGRLVTWTAAYLAIVWVVLELTDVLGEVWSWSVLLQDAVALALAFTIKPLLVVAWLQGGRGRRALLPAQIPLTLGAVVGVALAVWSICRQVVGAFSARLLSVFSRRTRRSSRAGGRS